MTDDALKTLWTTGDLAEREPARAVVERVLAEERAARGKEWSARLAGALTTLLLPVLLWSASHGVDARVRAGYALMAVGYAFALSTTWTYANWERQQLPGPVDARSQLSTLALALSRQAHLFRTAPLWCAPIFLGGLLIGTWVYTERTRAGAYVLWATVAALWFLMFLNSSAKSTALELRRAHVEQILNDLA